MEALQLIGLLVMFIGVLGTLVAAFTTGLWWGLGCLFLWPVSLLFLVVHWDVAKNPFFFLFFGLVLILIGGGWR